MGIVRLVLRLCPRSPFRFGAMGFTLVELLVVVAVLGLLAGLVFPAVSGALKKAREARCASNLKQRARLERKIGDRR